MTSPWKKHKAKWSDCDRCVLSERRRRVVLLRGKIPAPILFIGEAPGASEDALGKPFVGPAGKLLDRIIEASLGDEYGYALTNLVACIPRDEEGNKVTEPNRECIEACEPRLKEIVRIVKPQLIVLVGKLSGKYVTGQAQFATSREGDTPHWLDGPMGFVEIIHPAAILRMDISQRGLAIQRSIVSIQDAVSEYLED